MKALNAHEKERQKLADLQKQYEKSLAKRNKQLLEIMTEIDLGSVNGYAIIGALLDAKEKSQKNDPLCENWIKLGKNFTRRSKRRSL